MLGSYCPSAWIWLFSLYVDFWYNAFVSFFIWLLINDIPVCSCRVTSGVTLGNFFIILRTSFWKVCSLFMWALAYVNMGRRTDLCTITAILMSTVEDLFRIGNIALVCSWFCAECRIYGSCMLALNRQAMVSLKLFIGRVPPRWWQKRLEKSVSVQFCVLTFILHFWNHGSKSAIA
jgi:hypothetical protein